MLKEHKEIALEMNLDRVVTAWEMGMDRICRDAPHVIIAHDEKANRTAATSCTIALTYLELAIPAFGLGGCWAGFFGVAAATWKPMQMDLGLPEGHLCYGAMLIGHPKYKYQRMPLRNEPKIIWG